MSTVIAGAKGSSAVSGPGSGKGAGAGAGVAVIVAKRLRLWVVPKWVAWGLSGRRSSFLPCVEGGGEDRGVVI